MKHPALRAKRRPPTLHACTDPPVTATATAAPAPGQSLASGSGSHQRIEQDALGEVAVAETALWGAQTQRALHHFSLQADPMPYPVIEALALIKSTAARANAALGMLDAVQAEAIARAGEEVLRGRHREAFRVSVWQSGSGTQTHMNMNEVLANRASELLGGGRGSARTVHPNDHVNLGQSSNDTMPSAVHLAVLQVSREQLTPAIESLVTTLATHVQAFEAVVKTGRTHLQDAVPLTLGHEVAAWKSQLETAHHHYRQTLSSLNHLALGGTAVGSGLNAHPRFGGLVIRALAEATGHPLRPAVDPYAAQAAHDDLLAVHSALRGLAVVLMKIANDIRLLGSGPRCGLGELLVPANEPGSSAMPGKVNPSQCEALVMMAGQVLGNDVAMAFAGTSGHLQLNTALPLMAHNLMHSLQLLAHGIRDFDRHCVQGLQPNHARIAEHLANSLMLTTALVPHLGHGPAARLAQQALAQGLSLRDVAIHQGGLTAEQFDAWVCPAQMAGLGPRADAAN